MFLSKTTYFSHALLNFRFQNFAVTIQSTGNASKSVGLSWQPPVAYLQNGVVRGYVVSYLTTDARLVAQSLPVSVVAFQTSTVIPGGLCCASDALYSCAPQQSFAHSPRPAAFCELHVHHLGLHGCGQLVLHDQHCHCHGIVAAHRWLM